MLRKIFHFLLAVIILGTSSCIINISDDDKDVADSFDSATMQLNQVIAKSNPVIKKIHFGTIDNKEVFLFTLDNQNGLQVKITNYGGIITSIMVPDKNGKIGDVVLGYDSLSQYVANNSPYFGAVVGRYANRIARGRFTLDGKSYQLAVNNGKNTLHGGLKGFDKVVWDVQENRDSSKNELVLTYTSKDGEEGYPGNLNVKVTYTLDAHNCLTTSIEAQTDKATPVNICNHTYFNLRAADTTILGHHLTLYANEFTPVNNELIPTGAIAKVHQTAMDFNNSQQIGSRISKVKGGYDHNYVLTKKAGELSVAAQVYDPGSGRQVEISTTQPGVQLYTGNFLDGSIIGKGGKVYQKHFGFCLETQHFPDSPNQPSFPTAILRPGQKYEQTTVYRFTALK
jgi:aldose 1-epimerase